MYNRNRSSVKQQVLDTRLYMLSVDQACLWKVILVHNLQLLHSTGLNIHVCCLQRHDLYGFSRTRFETAGRSLTHFCPVDSSPSIFSTSISDIKDVCYFNHFYRYISILCTRCRPDQTPHSSDLGLYCFPNSLYRTLGISGLWVSSSVITVLPLFSSYRDIEQSVLLFLVRIHFIRE